MFKMILVGNDGSEGAFRALAVGIGLAKQHKADLHMISVEELPQFAATVGEVIEEQDTANHRFADVAAQAKQMAGREGVALTCHIARGHVVARIAEFIEASGVDLLVIGFMGHSRLYNAVIGGTADRLVDHARCSVMVVK